MKIVVQIEPDQFELVLDELKHGDFIVDKNTYCYFRDEVFIKGIEKFIRNVAPGSWKDMSGLVGADRFNNWFDNQELICKYYQKYRKYENKYHLYNNDIYIYKLIGFINVGNEIQLLKLDMKDVLDLLNM
jgi:hypothetical protein